MNGKKKQSTNYGHIRKKIILYFMIFIKFVSFCFHLKILRPSKSSFTNSNRILFVQPIFDDINTNLIGRINYNLSIVLLFHLVNKH